MQSLRDDLAQREAHGLLRELRVVETSGPMLYTADGRAYVNFTSNDYLGLSEHPAMKRAAVEAIEAHGTGSGASQLITGRGPVHERAERAFASFKHAEGAVLLPTGYMANLAAVTALAGPGDLVCMDKLCHASLIDAAKASGADVRTYPHLKTEKLKRLLSKHATQAACGLANFREDSRENIRANFRANLRGNFRGRFIVTDSIFSMDGDCADLPALCDLADEFDAVLIVDEAHGTGVLGETGAGLIEAQGVTGRVHVTVSTASKALGSLGGIITASRPVIDTLVNRARPMIYTTAIPPAQAATIHRAVELIQQDPAPRQRLHDLTMLLRTGLEKQGWQLPDQGEHLTPIIPLIVGESDAATALADHLIAQGFAVPAIRPPTVPPGSARVRLSLRADMTDNHIDQLLSKLSRR